MDNNNQITPDGGCDVLQNAAGEIMLIIKARPGGPENPRFVYDGGPKALLYRSKENSVILRDITEGARAPLKSVDEIFIVEVDGDEVIREYSSPVRIIRDIESLAKTINVAI